jgi:LPS-assembly lipoprotein
MKLSRRQQGLAAAIGLLGLGGCGFTPLYAVQGVSSQLSAIEVARPDGRTGYLLGQSLDDELGRDTRADPQYRLTVQLNEVRAGRGININNVATEYEVDLTANYQLTDYKTRQQVTKGVVAVNATYNTANQPYASVADELDAEGRAAETAAQRIRLALASYFASPHPNGAVVPAQGVTNNAFIGVPTNETVQTPRERAAKAADPGAADLPDPNATGGSAGGSP